MLPAVPENVLRTPEEENIKFIVKKAVARTTIMATMTTVV
jgi:hypothetical protein